MSLVPREQETLCAIESQLRMTDPRFAAMFRVFDSGGPRSKARLWVFMSVWLARQGWAAVLVMVATIITLVASFAAVAALFA